MKNRELIKKIAVSASNYPDVTFSNKRQVYTCINPYSYHIVRKNKQLYDNMDGLFVDGMFLCLLIKIFWGKTIPRLSFDMVGIAKDLFVAFNSKDKNESIYFIGAHQEAIEGTIAQIRKTYPDLSICGYRNGYFKDDNDKLSAIDKIIESKADFAIIGMGSPIQEQFALELKQRGFKGIIFTCGGFLHQTSMRMNYYPDWVNKYNLRAFYRLAHEKGMFKRLFHVLVSCPVLFGWDSITSLISKSKNY